MNHMELNIKSIGVKSRLEVYLMNANKKYENRYELIDIYNSLTPSLKLQLLSTAKIIQATQHILLNEKKINKKKTLTED